MKTPRNLRRMEEFWLTRGEWFLITMLEGLAVLCVVASAVLVGMAIYNMGERPEPVSMEQAMQDLGAALSVPLCFGCAISCLSYAIGLLFPPLVPKLRPNSVPPMGCIGGFLGGIIPAGIGIDHRREVVFRG